MVKLAHLIPVLILVTSTLGHICMIYPEQRGGAKINGPGSHACFQPTAPCGTATPQPPTITLYGGTTFYVLVQQNLNHYNPGNPGFIDIGFSVGTNQTTDDQFLTLTSIPDYWPHLQGWQTNFTIPIRVPNVECEWCTLQVRYHPNKPTEPIFHNCADIAIATPATPIVQGRLMGIAKPGPSYSAEDNYSSFAVIDPISGATSRLSPTPYHIGIRDVAPHKNFKPIEFIGQELFIIANGLVAPLEQTNLYYFLSRQADNFERGPFSQLSEFNVDSLNYTSLPLTFPNGIDQWAGLVSTHSKATPAPFIIIGQTTSNNVYTFSPFWLFTNGTIVGPIGTTQSDSTFVNFFWTEFNPCAGSAGVVYILSGDENSLTTLDVTLYSIDVATGVVTAVLVNNTEFTVSSIHAWVGQDCQNLYTLSPGLINTPSSSRVWSLIQIEPSTGAIVQSTPVTPPGLYNEYYGGGIYGYPITANNQLLYLFRRSIDPSFDLYGINLQTRSVDFQTGVDLGVNGAFFVSSVMFTPE